MQELLNELIGAFHFFFDNGYVTKQPSIITGNMQAVDWNNIESWYGNCI